jgi:hypothetical protein
MIDLKNLSEEELRKLKEDVSAEIQNKVQEKIKYMSKKKGTLGALKSGDKILGIKLSAGPHKLAEPEELSCEVTIVDYCDVNYNDIRSDGTCRLDIKYNTGAFGISTTISKEQAGRHYLLIMDNFKSGYDAFYTLKPETWEEDFKTAFEELVQIHKGYLNKKLVVMMDKSNILTGSKDYINKHIPC